MRLPTPTTYLVNNDGIGSNFNKFMSVKVIMQYHYLLKTILLAGRKIGRGGALT